MKCGKDGWDELDITDFPHNDQVELWQLVAAGETREACDLVAQVLDRDESPCDVDMIAEPCELRVDWACYRIWIKECK